MKHGKRHFGWAHLLATASATLVCSVIAGLIIHYYTSKAPDLVYEAFPPAHFGGDATALSIYNIRVRNDGSKEAEEVTVRFNLPEASAVEDVKAEPSMKSMTFELRADAPNVRTVHFPLLNPGDGARFSVLVKEAHESDIQVEVRGRGVTGRKAEQSRGASWNDIFAMLSAIVGLVFASFAYLQARFAKTTDRLIARQQKQIGQQIRFFQNQEGLPLTQLTERLLKKRFRLYFAPGAGDGLRNKVMRFGESGKILEGRNANEDSWRFRGPYLEFLDSGGQVHSRFEYCWKERRFHQIGDLEQGSFKKHGIRGQFLVELHEDESS